MEDHWIEARTKRHQAAVPMFAYLGVIPTQMHPAQSKVV